jgi:hypothetical protein
MSSIRLPLTAALAACALVSAPAARANILVAPVSDAAPDTFGSRLCENSSGLSSGSVSFAFSSSQTVQKRKNLENFGQRGRLQNFAEFSHSLGP